MNLVVPTQRHRGSNQMVILITKEREKNAKKLVSMHDEYLGIIVVNMDHRINKYIFKMCTIYFSLN